MHSHTLPNANARTILVRTQVWKIVLLMFDASYQNLSKINKKVMSLIFYCKTLSLY